ncbi:hypothetical protein CONLIGDRAFT_645633 [Coniochaeta ligniaria NRRL 30616]|uniref:DUF7918 domain-containing protein n=1 Tax=Coniochaeta ligniaria NRRL 30616 TaxID=1408157 RepID=A0A1J7IIR1_9PEZI|nr:hypothetical protein CONLIGDRAFT_645633 [Coniochaeta ligniaria NRRL 30616]
MAVIKNLGLCATIQVNGMPLDEYDDPNPCEDTTVYKKAPSVCSKYVEVKDGAEYSIHFKALPKNRWISRFAPNDHVLKMNVYIDGKFQGGKKLKVKKSSDGTSMDGVSQYQGSHHKSIQRFKFSTLNTVDAAGAAVDQGDLQRANTLGLIRLVIDRGLRKGRKDACSTRLVAGADLTVAEEALKGKTVSHGTILSSAAAVEPKGNNPYTFSVTELVDEDPYAIFTFKYRSRDALQSEMIIPRPPSSDAPDEGLEGLSLDEIRRLARERLADVKKEKIVKTEASPVKREYDEAFDLTGDSPRKILRKRAEQETIDLTDD